jgi:putative heme-binding domain-containing protein
LSVVFGDGRTMNDLRAVAQDGSLDGQVRRDALQLLIDGRDEKLPPILKKLVGDRATASLAARGLALFDDPDTPNLLIGKYRLFHPEVQQEVIATLSSRKHYAGALLRAVERGQIPAGEISAFHARQIQSLKDDKLSELLARVWGEVRTTPADRKKLLDQYKKQLSEARLKDADLSRGRLVYKNACANCHKLYGEGETVGPDLTGSGRDNLDYLLENLIDPSAVVPNDFRMSAVTLKSGRILTGVLLNQTDKTVAVQGQKERVVIERAEIEEVVDTKMSLMPDGLLTPLKEDEVRDLIAYLRARTQVPLPSP